ncbi:MAG: DUF72 domain-containing protein [Myxococcales bacterium]|nr:DUF72 domain-containing protein [Myxococcales bacterium]MBL0194582.1 DUF72 domain-containing protein [Myxococcales bacterium]HQY63303.1 DUF72 domain-containing protein [Polyangiaceae bacterium]
MRRKASSPDQLGLFGGPAAEAPAASRGAPARARVTPEDLELAARVPPSVRFGTSSWTFPGWGGVLYEGAPTQAALLAGGLQAYATHPLFRVVGIDRSHYAPLDAATLAQYAAGLPAGFCAVSKVWDELTTCVFPAHPRFGERASHDNPSFLSAERFLTEVLPPYTAAFAPFAGPFVFEIPPMPPARVPAAEVFAARVDALLSRLPRAFRYAFELRNEALLTGAYLEVLRAHGASHVLNLWTGMPTLRRQLAVAGVAAAPFFVVRLMLPPFTRYDVRRADLAPFDRLVDPQHDARDDVLAIVRAAGGRDVFVLVNNKFEGCSPESVRELARRVVGELRPEISP